VPRVINIINAAVRQRAAARDADRAVPGSAPTALGFTTWAFALARSTAGRMAAATDAIPAPRSPGYGSQAEVPFPDGNPSRVARDDQIHALAARAGNRDENAYGADKPTPCGSFSAQEPHHREGPGGRPAPIHLICVTHAGFQQSMKLEPNGGYRAQVRQQR
jgi:hypothetical protein